MVYDLFNHDCEKRVADAGVRGKGARGTHVELDLLGCSAFLGFTVSWVQGLVLPGFDVLEERDGGEA